MGKSSAYCFLGAQGKFRGLQARRRRRHYPFYHLSHFRIMASLLVPVANNEYICNVNGILRELRGNRNESSANHFPPSPIRVFACVYQPSRFGPEKRGFSHFPGHAHTHQLGLRSAPEKMLCVFRAQRCRRWLREKS